MRNTHFRTWNIARKTEKGGKRTEERRGGRSVESGGVVVIEKTENHGK